MTNFREQYGPWALVTGASAGIGREFALQLAAHKLNLILVARRKRSLEALSQEIQQMHGVETIIVPLDLRTDTFLDQLRTATAGREVGFLVNNAGTVIMGKFIENDLNEELGSLSLNTRVPLALSHFYGREMMKHGRGGILIVSSMVAFMGAPRMANYAATKAYDLLLGETLNYELSGSGVDVATLLPGFTSPGFTDHLDLSRLPMPIAKTPAVVRTALQAMGRKSLIIPGVMNKLMYWLTPMMPRRMNTAMMGIMMGRVGWKAVTATSEARV